MKNLIDIIPLVFLQFKLELGLGFRAHPRVGQAWPRAGQTR
jgi:hypothetical protein